MVGRASMHAKWRLAAPRFWADSPTLGLAQRELSPHHLYPMKTILRAVREEWQKVTADMSRRDIIADVLSALFLMIGVYVLFMLT